MEMVTNAVNWVEIPVSDFSRAQKFYSAIFDYDMPANQMGDKMMGFFLAEPGGVSGAIVQGEGYKPSREGALVYLSGGRDLSVVLGRVEAAGGQIILPKTLITDEIGFIALFVDCEGNKIGLHSMQ